MDTQRTAADECGAYGGTRPRQLPAYLPVSLPQSLMPHNIPLWDNSKDTSVQQLRSLKLQADSATPGDQLYTALGPPPCLSLPAAVDEATQWDVASHARPIRMQLQHKQI